MIEWRIKRKLRSFIGRDGTQQVGDVWRVIEDATKGLIVLCDGRDTGDRCIEIRLAHFARIDDRLGRLILECPHAAVPKLRFIVKSIQDSRRVPLADVAFNTDRDGPAVGESLFGVVAATASDSPISRQATLEEQFLAEGNFPGGLGVVGWYRGAGGIGGDASLLKRLWLGKRFGLGSEHGVRVLLFGSGSRGFGIRIRSTAEQVQSDA